MLIITSTGDRLFKFINIDDLEWSWTFPKGVFSEFSQYLDASHISILNCDEMAGVRPRQPAYEICSIKGRFQQAKSRSPRFMEPGASGRLKRLPLLKSGYFTTIIRCSVKTIAHRYRHLWKRQEERKKKKRVKKGKLWVENLGRKRKKRKGKGRGSFSNLHFWLRHWVLCLQQQ